MNTGRALGADGVSPAVFLNPNVEESSGFKELNIKAAKPPAWQRVHIDGEIGTAAGAATRGCGPAKPEPLP